MNPMASRWAKLYKGTPAELMLESAVAELGVPYRTQFPYYLYGLRYFPDFLLPTLGIIIEVDDPSHDKPSKQLEDAERTLDLENEGWTVVRCKNKNALDDPRGTVRALIRSVGLDPDDLPRSARTQSVADSLPQPKKAGQRQKRAAIRAERARRRGTPRPGASAPPKPPRLPSPPPEDSSAPA